MGQSMIDEKLSALTDALYDVSLPSTIRVPGAPGTSALEVVFGMLVAKFLGWNDETTLRLMLDREAHQDSVPMRLGIAFAASIQVNTGNRYGVVAIISVLKSFSNTEVTPQEAQLLQLLETHVKAAGNTVPEEVAH
jgi:hypothetical protein